MSEQTRRRLAAATELAERSFGVVARRQLLTLGITRHHVRRQTDAGRWMPLGPQSVRVLAAPWDARLSPIVAATHDAGASAWADGESALLLAGLQGWQPRHVHVASAQGTYLRPRPGVVMHRVTLVPAMVGHPVARTRACDAALHAAAWAHTPRQAAALLSMSVQQRLTHPRLLDEALALRPQLRRRRLIAGLIRDIAGGSESMGELDFLAQCRRRKLPLPDRQVQRRTPAGTYKLDVHWDAAGLAVEVDGAHHYLGENPSLDALRQNEISMQHLTVLRIPRVALRVNPEPFFEQIERVLAARHPRT